MIRRGVLLLAFCGAAAGLAAESLDSLFDTVNSDTVVTPDATAKVDALDRPVFLYFGNMETKGVVASGWTDGSSSDPVTSLYYFLHFQGGIDVQPIPQARLIGTFSTYLPQDLDSSIVDNVRNGTTQEGTSTSTTTTANTSQVLSLDELFLDYTIYDSAFFRIGKFGQTWGLGHLFNPGNFVSTTSDGVNLKTFAAAGPFSLTGMVIANPSFLSDKSHPRADELGYAGDLGVSAGLFTGGGEIYWQRKAGLKLDGSLKTSLLGFDLYAELLGYQNPANGEWWPGMLAGVFYQLRMDWQWKLLAEYLVDGSTFQPGRRSLGVGATSDPVISGLDLKLSARWYHSLYDQSGQVVTGFDITPLPKLNIAIGVPWTYGPRDGVYVVGNTDPESRTLAAFLTIGVNFDFEKAR